MERSSFSTHLLDAAVRRRGERLEAERRAVLEKVIQILRREASRLGIRRAYAVGSIASEGAWADESDVDVAIVGGDPLQVMKLLEEVTGRDVDVVELERHAAPGIFLRRGIEIVG